MFSSANNLTHYAHNYIRSRKHVPNNIGLLALQLRERNQYKSFLCSRRILSWANDYLCSAHHPFKILNPLVRLYMSSDMHLCLRIYCSRSAVVSGCLECSVTGMLNNWNAHWCSLTSGCIHVRIRAYVAFSSLCVFLQIHVCLYISASLPLCSLSLSGCPSRLVVNPSTHNSAKMHLSNLTLNQRNLPFIGYQNVCSSNGGNCKSIVKIMTNEGVLSDYL